MARPIRVLLLIPRLNAGGAARVSTNVARGLADRGYEVHLAVASGKPVRDHWHIAVPVHWLGSSQVRWSAAALVRLVRRLRPHVVLSNMTHLNLLVLGLRPAFPRHTRVAVRHDGGVRLETLSPVRRSAFRLLHSSADAVICQSEQMRAELAAQLGNRDLLHILPNPVAAEEVLAADWEHSQWSGSGINLLAVGRLVKQKGFDLLLQAFALVAAKFPRAKLAIIGDGPERGNLDVLSKELGLDDRVHFAGQIRDPQRWFAGASAFVLSSRQDALPNALLEAAAAGLPIIALPARGGVPELLKNHPGAWIAREVSASSLAETLDQVLPALTPGQRFNHRWIDPFAWRNAIDRYDELVRSLTRSAP